MIQTCIEYEDGRACAGALKSVPIKGYYSSFRVERHKEGKKQASDAHDDPFWKSPTEPINGTLVKASIPYTELGLKPGSTVRVVVREADASWSLNDKGYFPIATLTLK